MAPSIQSWLSPSVASCGTSAFQASNEGINNALLLSPRTISRKNFSLDAAYIYHKLTESVSTHLAGQQESGAAFVRKCIELYIQYQFPNTPITHEPTLWAAATLFDQGAIRKFSSSGRGDMPSIETLRGFTLITALCALVISVMPKELLDVSKELTWPYYYASRAMLGLYDEHDLEFPHSTSYYVRTWHSAAVENTTGRDTVSWNIHCEGVLLALRARIYDEVIVNRLPPVEAQLMRVNWSLMYLADRTAAAFEVRPYVINDDFNSDGLDFMEEVANEGLLLDTTRPCNENLEARLLAGFRIKKRLWSAAANITHELRAFSKLHHPVAIEVHPLQEDIEKLANKYLRFVGIIDDLPQWLQFPHGYDSDTMNDEIARYQSVCFWAQRANIMSVYHCMKIVILQICIDANIPGVVGLNEQPIAWAMHKLDIGRDFLREITTAPFACLKVQGEPAVERIRRVGSLLLALVNDAPTSAIEEKAKSQFERLLDFLTSLDSRASDNIEVPNFATDFCQ